MTDLHRLHADHERVRQRPQHECHGGEPSRRLAAPGEVNGVGA